MVRVSGGGGDPSDSQQKQDVEKKKKRNKNESCVTKSKRSLWCCWTASVLSCLTTVAAVIYSLFVWHNFDDSNRDDSEVPWYRRLLSYIQFHDKDEQKELSQWYRLQHLYGIYMESFIYDALTKYLAEETVFIILQVLCSIPLVITTIVLLVITYRCWTTDAKNAKKKQKSKKNRNDSNGFGLGWGIVLFISLVSSFVIIVLCDLTQVWIYAQGVGNNLSLAIHSNYETVTRLLYLCLLSLAISILIVLYCKIIKSKSGETTKRKRNRKDSVEEVEVLSVYSNSGHPWARCVMYVVVLISAVSIPWEFVRMYQQEVAKKMSILQSGIPPECFPQDLGMWSSIKSWMKWQFSWDSTSHCERYHQALLVDPVWEVTPLMVLTSAFTRCVTRPIEMISHSIGHSLQLIFVNIPVVWQPVVMVILTVVLVMLAVMKCQYKISVPMFLHIEPSRTPSRTSRTSCCRQMTSEKMIEYKTENEP